MEAPMIVGYARCSTGSQDYEGQLVCLKQAGAEKIYAEKISAVVTDRRSERYTVSTQVTCSW
jgi:DNA invertase Pin-like site-specific DNA recombinase